MSATPRPAAVSIGGAAGGLRFARETALLDRLQQEIRLIERQLRVQKGQTQFLSLRYSKRMVIICNVVLGCFTFFSEFALHWRSLNRQRALAAWRAHRHGWVWSPGGLLRRLMAAALPEDAQPSSLLAAALVASGISAWEHSLWFFVSGWFVYSEPWASVEGVTSAFGAWCSVLGLAFRNDVSSIAETLSADDAAAAADAAADASTAPPVPLQFNERHSNALTKSSLTHALSESLPPLQSPFVRSAAAPSLAPNTPFSDHIARTTLSFPKLHDGRTDDLLSLPRVPHSTICRVAHCDDQKSFVSSSLSLVPSLLPLSPPSLSAAQTTVSQFQRQQSATPQSLFSARGDRGSVGRSAILEDEDEAENKSPVVNAVIPVGSQSRDADETAPVKLAHGPSHALPSLRLLSCWRFAARAGQLLSFLRPGLAGCITSTLASASWVIRRSAPLRWAHFMSMFFLSCYLTLRYSIRVSSVALATRA